MTRMTAAEAAVHIMEKEGAACAFGIPGGATKNRKRDQSVMGQPNWKLSASSPTALAGFSFASCGTIC
jgi:hypothetical protein